MAADKYGIERKSIRNWRKKLPELHNARQIFQKYSSSLKKVETDEVENEIVDWILINRS